MIIRPALPEDSDQILAILEANDMQGEVAPEQISGDNCLVAVEDDQVLGFVRLEFVGSVPYIRPIAVWPDACKMGIGSKLMGIVLETHPVVRAVSRGGAAEFYRRLGFERTEWSEVHPPFREECELCPEKTRCTPSPMKFKAAHDREAR